MRVYGSSLILCVLLAIVQRGYSSRSLQQFPSELGSNNAASPAASPSTYDYGDYETAICYSPLDIVSALNTTDNLTYFQEALYNTGIADLLTDPLSTLTVLAPDDSAFLNAADMLGMDIEDLVASPVVIPVLLNHIVGLPILSSEVANMSGIVPTALGQYLNVSEGATNNTLEFSSLAATAEVVDGDYCGCDLCTSVVDVIDTVLLPDILNITTEGPETVIILGTPSGKQQVFVVVDESALLAPSAAPDAPAMAPAQEATNSTQPAGLALAPATSGTMRQGATSTSTGMTYFTNTAANS